MSKFNVGNKEFFTFFYIILDKNVHAGKQVYLAVYYHSLETKKQNILITMILIICKLLYDSTNLILY